MGRIDQPESVGWIDQPGCVGRVDQPECVDLGCPYIVKQIINDSEFGVYSCFMMMV